MLKSRFLTILCMVFLLVFVYGCNKGSSDTEAAGANTLEEQGEQAGEGEKEEHAGDAEQGEHEGEEQGEHAEEGEEAGPRISKEGTHNEVRKGARLILSFDIESSCFIGTLENVTEETLTGVRIEVHLSNGTELGPTPPIDLVPGKKVDVGLSAEGQSFEWWKAHVEVGTSEH